MSKKRARLVRSDSFYTNQYYNLYNNNIVLSNKFLKSFSVPKEIKEFYNLTNVKSLQYSAIYKKSRYLTTKVSHKIESYNYPLYMKCLFESTSDLNYNNTYYVYNILNCKGSNNYGINFKTMNKLKLPLRREFFTYKRSSSYFINTYKHYIRHFFEQEDENKLIKRKANLKKLQTYYEKYYI